jgi:hypothetical protein
MPGIVVGGVSVYANSSIGACTPIALFEPGNLSMTKRGAANLSRWATYLLSPHSDSNSSVKQKLR